MWILERKASSNSPIPESERGDSQLWATGRSILYPNVSYDLSLGSRLQHSIPVCEGKLPLSAGHVSAYHCSLGLTGDKRVAIELARGSLRQENVGLV